MEKQFWEKKDKAVKIKGKRYIDITINEKIMHYLVEGLSKLNGTKDNKERVELEIINNELNEINDELNRV